MELEFAFCYSAGIVPDAIILWSTRIFKCEGIDPMLLDTIPGFLLSCYKERAISLGF